MATNAELEAAANKALEDTLNAGGIVEYEVGDHQVERAPMLDMLKVSDILASRGSRGCGISFGTVVSKR